MHVCSYRKTVRDMHVLGQEDNSEEQRGESWIPVPNLAWDFNYMSQLIPFLLKLV